MGALEVPSRRRIETYKQAFEEVLGLRFDASWQSFIRGLEQDGHIEKSVCFAIWKSQEKLLAFKHDNRFKGILRNEINKWSWRKGDPRWDEYWKRKREEARVAERLKEIDAEREAKQRELLLRTRRGRKTAGLPGYIYFIQGENGGAVKIGHSMDPVKRLRDLQTGYPDTLVLLLMIEGTPEREEAIHQELAASRLNGEWFRPDQCVLDIIKRFEVEEQEEGRDK